MFNTRKPYFGVNYYPESWDKSEIEKDLDQMLSFGFNCVRIAEFAWSIMEKSDGVFDFSLFRFVVDECKKRGIAVIMCTPTACPPRWLYKKHPEILLVIANNGYRLPTSTRGNTCNTSEVYFSYAKRIIEKMAQEFCNDENVIGWQIDNEVNPEKFDCNGCCCSNCVKEFREWLRVRYSNDIEKLNVEWGNNVWSQNYSDFDEIDAPLPATYSWNHPSYFYNWQLFQNEVLLDFVAFQYKILKKYVKVPVGHDGMIVFYTDYDRLSRETDIMMLNEYTSDVGLYEAAEWFDFDRSQKDKPFWLTETSPCWNGGTTSNEMRAKNFNKANVWLAYLMGAELVNYWLWRSHYGGQEVMHGAVVSATGRPFHNADEVRELSAEISRSAELLNSTWVEDSQIAIHVSYSGYKMWRSQAIVSGFDYRDDLREKIYRPIRQAQYSTDVITMGRPLDKYKMLVTSFAFNLDEQGAYPHIIEWVKNGGVWIVGPLSDIRTEHGAKYIKNVLGHLEIDTESRLEFTLPKGESYNVKMFGEENGSSISFSYDAFSVGGNTKSVAEYTDGDFIKGYSAITETPYGKGKIVILGFLPDSATLKRIVKHYADGCGVLPNTVASDSVVTIYRSGNGARLFGAVETEKKAAKVVVPFDGKDILTEIEYHSGEEVSLEPLGRLIIKKTK